MSLSSINDMDSHNLIIALYSDALESDNTIPEPQFTIVGNDYSTLTWSGTTMPKPTEAQLLAKYNSTKNSIRDKLVRERRDRLLLESDKYAVKDFPFRTKTKRDQWMSYRSNLRNLTQNLSNFTVDLRNFEISNFDTHKPTEPEEETGEETKTFDEDDTIVDGKFIITGHNTLNNFLVGDGTSYVPKTPSQIKSILDLEVGSDVQAYDSALNAIANISPSNNKIAVFSGPTTAKLIDFRDEDNMISNSSTSIPSQQSVKAYVDTKVSNLVDSAPGTLDTLNELAAALGDDANFSSTISTSLGEKLVKSSNLSDLSNASTARTNLGLTIGSDVQAYNANLVPVTANPGSGTALSSIGINGTNYSISAGGSGIGITGTYASEWKMDAPKDNGTICVGSLYITNSGSGQTQATGSWTGSRNLFIGSGAGGYQTSSNGNNTFIGGATALNWQKGDGNTFLGSRAGEDIQGTTNSTNNTFLGFASGDLIQQGDNNICLGAFAGPHQAYTNHNYRLYINMAGSAKGSNGFIYGDQSAKPTLLINADVTIKNGSSAISSSNNPSGNLTVYGDITLHDGGSLKEASGTSALTFDSSGNITKIGQDSPTSGQFLKWDGSKAVWDTVSGGGGSGVITGITNFSNNKLVTASGSSTLNGEGALTFDSTSGLFTLNHSTPEFKIRSSANEGIPKLTLIGDYDADRGDIWQITTNNGVMSFSTDHISAGTPDQTMLRLVGNLTNVTNSYVDVMGKLNVAKLATFSDDVKLLNDKKIYLSTSLSNYIQGNSTSINIESHDYLNIHTDIETKINSYQMRLHGSKTTVCDFEIRNTYSSSAGKASITLIGDNGNDLGDGWRIACGASNMSFSSDNTTDATYDTEMLRLTNHSNQLYRHALFYSNVNVKGGLKMEIDNKIYWHGSTQYISGNTTSITIDCNDNFNLYADTLINFSCAASSFSGNLDVGNGLDVTGNMTCSGHLDIEDAILMSSNKKIQWVNTGTFISGTDTKLTIDGDDTLALNADTTITLTCPTINFSGNANVSSGLDVTGNITCSGYLDIEGAVKMATSQKIQWVNTGTFISGTDTTLTIDCDDNLNVYCDTKMFVFTPETEFNTNVTGGKDFKIKSTDTTNGFTKLSLISRNGSGYGDTWQLKNDTQKLQFFTDKTTRGTANDLIFELVGHSNPILSSTNVSGYLNVVSEAYFKNLIKLDFDKKLYWGTSSTSYIVGGATTMTIESKDYLNIYSDIETKIHSYQLKLEGSRTTVCDFEIRNTYSSSAGKASITLIGDNGNDLGDGWRIACGASNMSFSSDNTTDATYDTEMLRLTNHSNQLYRHALFYSNVNIKEALKMEIDKKIYWHGTTQYISGNTTSITIDCNDNFNLYADTLINFSCSASSFSGNLDVGNGLDVTGNMTCSGHLDIEDAILMSSNKKIQWVNTGTFISGTDTKLTIDGDDTLALNADTTMTLTCPTINFSGNANVSSGLDVTGNITCSGYLDIEGAVKMATSQKIQWVNTGTFISGTDTTLTIDCDDNLNVYCDTKMFVFTPETEFNTNVTGGKDFKIKSTDTTDGFTKLSLISRNGSAYGDTWQLKNDTQKLQFLTDKTTRGTADDLIFELVGHSNPTLSSTNVSGYLNVVSEAYFKNLIKLDADKKLYWGTSSTAYIVGGATTMTIESNDYLNIYSDFETKIHSYQLKLEGSRNTVCDFEIRNTYSSGAGQASITLIGDNGNDLGDGWRIACGGSQMSFSSDNTTDATYDTEMLRLINHSNQLYRNAVFYSNLNIKEALKMEINKKIYWGGTTQYISGNLTSITIDCNDNFTVYADTLINFSCSASSFSGNLDVGNGLDVTGNMTCSGHLNIEDAILMSSNKKIQWVNTGTYISGTDTKLTIDGDDTLALNADTTMTLTCPTINFSGNANVSSGLDVTGNITCSGYLDIEGAVKMATSQKIQWVNTGTFISGTDTTLSIDCDDTLSVYCDTKMSVFTPLTEYYTNLAGGKDFKIKSTNTTDGFTKLSLISRNGAAYGDIWQLKNDTQKLQFLTDKTTRGTPDDIIFELVGHSNPTLSSANVSGYLNVESEAYFKNLIKLDADKKLYWGTSSTAYIVGGATTMTIESNDYLNIYSDLETKIHSYQMKLEGSRGTVCDFEIKNTYSSASGQASITFIGDNGNDLGDGWRIACGASQMIFSSDNTTDATYDTQILKLTNHSTQSSRVVNIYGKLDVSNGFSLDIGSDATADMFYRNSSGNFARLPKGTAGQVLKMNSNATAPEWSSSSGGVTISNNANNRVLTGDGTNANAEANMTFSGSALNVVGTITCDTSLTIDSSVLDASDILHISDITEGVATINKAVVLSSNKSIFGINTLGCSSIACSSFATSSNANLELDPNGSGVVVFKGNSTRESGQFKLNCENNTHGITIKGPPHSAGATYILTLPDTHGSADQVLKTDGSGNLSWTDMSSGGGGASALNDLSDVSISSLSVGQVLKYNGTNWVNDTDNTGSGGGGGGGLPSGVSYTGSGASAEFVVTGNIRATADITAYHSSDRRFKDNLTRISEPNEKIKKINGYEFDWNEKHEHYKNTHDVGVVAQEIEEVLPEVVTEREDGYKAVKYERIIALLIESNKDLLRRVEELEKKLKK